MTTSNDWPGKPGADVVADTNIREGAYYRTRGGDVVGPMRMDNHPIYPLITLGNQWAKCGRWGASGKEHPLDLISEVYVSGAPDQATALQARGGIGGALREMIYETTHLSPQEDDGSHWCKISKSALEKARAALEGKKE